MRRLRGAGEDVIYMMESAPGASDAEAISRAWRDRRLLLTEDKDFGDLVFRQARIVPGLVLLRIDTLFGRYTVIETARFRSRPLRRASP